MSKEVAKRFLEFINQTGSPYHSVAACKQLLVAKGFECLSEKTSDWKVSRGGKYFITRDHSEIFAFVVGKQFDAKTSGIVMIGAHTDSPCLMIRPHSHQLREKHIQLGVSTYGGGLWHTWFDRGLGVAGKLIYRTSSGSLVEALVKIDRSVCFIPNLAIHLLSNDERKAFDVNTENHLMPVFATTKTVPEAPTIAGHHPAFIKLLKDSAGCPEDAEITDISLCLFDATPGQFVGVSDEFVQSGRIDNQLSTWAAFDSLASEDSNEHDISIAAAFNHEEVGSSSATGADSQTVANWISKILKALKADDMHSVLARSILVSADCAHGIHPNYSSKHQAEHKVYLQGGVVFKGNVNQRYSTTCVTSALARQVCKLGSVPVQDFLVRNDSPCGSTIGPMLSANLGIRSIDIGATQWAMHSCRETCGVDDVMNIRQACAAFYKYWRQVDDSHREI